MTDPLGIVFAADPRRPWLAARSARSLARAGVPGARVVASADGSLPPTADDPGRPVVLLRAGAWLRAGGPLRPPPASATGRAVVAVGQPVGDPDADAWRAAWDRCGGDFSVGPAPPPIVCAWVGAGTGQATALAALFAGIGTVPDDTARARCDTGSDFSTRVVGEPPLAASPIKAVRSRAPGKPNPYDVSQKGRVAGATRPLREDGNRSPDPPAAVDAVLAASGHPPAGVPSAGVSAKPARAGGPAPRLPADHRVVHWPALDANVDDGPGPRVVQVVTTLQHGGAERVTWDLHDLLPAAGVASCLVTLGRPARRTLPDPRGRIDLSDLPPADRVAAAAGVAAWFGADVIHAHLLRGPDAAALAAAAGGVPLVMTIHNTRPGWPPGLADLAPGAAALIVACARAVERDVVAARLPAPVRTARNGIDVGAYAAAGAVATDRPPQSPRSDLALVCVANPRPQKRLDRLPAVLAALRVRLAAGGTDPAGGGGGERGHRWRDARLVVAGEAAPDSAADDCLADLRRAAAAAGVSDRVIFTGGGPDVRGVLAAADVFVSVAAHEGLSLAMLEARAAGLPVVATDVGGAAEVAAVDPGVTLVRPDAAADEVAAAVLAAVPRGPGFQPVRTERESEGPGFTDARGRPHGLETRATGAVPVSPHPSPPGTDPIRQHFARERMAARYAWLYRAALGPPGGGDVVWFVANNLTTGGAQSSLRRLVKALHADGVPVRVAVLQEYADHPTPGRLDLLAAGVPVTVLPPAGLLDPADAVAELLGEMNACPPWSVTFWNAIQSYKLLLADALLRVPVFDVSPGEMYFASLDAYFARPRPGLPYHTARDYGERLAGVVVKYAAEADRAAAALGCPVHVIPNGVPLPPPRPPRTPEPDEFVIGTACRLHPHKRVEDLLDAFRLAQTRLPARAVLRLAGGADTGHDDYARMLRDRLADLQVEWLGEIDDIGAFHAGLDLFAMISEPAGCPNASLEAMAAGLPVVATDVGGASEQVVDGETGWLVPPRDAAAFAEVLVDAAARPARRHEMGAAARCRARARFSLDDMLAGYRRLIAPPGGTVFR